MQMTNHSIQRILLTGLLSILSVGAARADIENPFVSRNISAETTANSTDNGTSYTASQSDGTALLGAFTRSYVQGASLSLVQTQTTLSHNSTITLSTDEVQIDGMRRAIVSQNNERDENLAAGSADLAQTTNLRFIFDLTEDANFTLTATTTRLIQFVSYASYLTFSGDAPGFATIIAGDSLNGPSGPNSLNLSGTLAPGR